MKIIPDVGGFQLVTEFGIRMTGNFFLIGLVVGLVSVWVLTESFCELVNWMAGSKNK